LNYQVFLQHTILPILCQVKVVIAVVIAYAAELAREWIIPVSFTTYSWTPIL